MEKQKINKFDFFYKIKDLNNRKVNTKKENIYRLLKIINAALIVNFTSSQLNGLLSLSFFVRDDTKYLLFLSMLFGASMFYLFTEFLRSFKELYIDIKNHYRN